MAAVSSSSAAAEESVVDLYSELNTLRELMRQSKANMENVKKTIEKERAGAPRDLRKMSEGLTKAYISSCNESFDPMICRAAATCSQKVLAIILSRISETRQSRTSPRTPGISGAPVKRSPKDDIWSYKEDVVLSPGDEVAALVDEHSDPNLWILASIKSYDEARNRYTVLDEDPGDESSALQRKTYIVEAEKIISLPSLSQVPLKKRVEFVTDENVLAIFPKTTVFYPARVVDAPRKLRSPHYLLQFHDDHGLSRKVAAQHVVPLPARYYEK